MRILLCTFVMFFGLSGALLAQNSKYPPPDKKPIQLPSVDVLRGYPGNFSADQSNVWQTPDPSNQYQAGQSASSPVLGLKFKRDLY